MRDAQPDGSRAMELASEFRVIPSEGDRPGAYASFPYDSDLVERFRDAFPRARWRPDEQCWFVPGTTAADRLDVWISRELADLDRHADEKGRDAFAFDPLESRYLDVGDELGVRTPYSRTIVEAMRTIPWARWDPSERIWRVPFRSFEELRHRWPLIEEAARRNEPEARRRRQEERKQSADPAAAALEAERRRRRYPVPADDIPPLDTPLATLGPGVVVFEETGNEPIGADDVPARYPHVRDPAPVYVWGKWRLPTLAELYRARPERHPCDDADKLARGWWRPDRMELRERIRRVRQIERMKRTRTEASR